ncbi:chemotaxis protein CheW [Entomospira culicis]|uniref:Chemotaxis protein CheW n=1 Tax=Entomospira culicis TaxID=2719989 RepID=A0A968GF66_9SPIO|nr:chemotaxis protein CheW [Entomospira culicis]NIZ18500.1 chemotaxis protein CheW [Entomospira culicis]NIZ68716.1 chemotaxis protein CheW [Entomospira culicis]WDI37981.1 chemotaxis protein CheW [Entomospira culicis]WDI39604.1 chemotaxis protein CheW [Entomospira culicis]
MSDKKQLVTFQLGEERYGIDIMHVKEIYSNHTVRPIPHAPAYIEGVLNLRGEIIPIINLHRRFGIAKALLSEDDAMLSGFVIINLSGMKVGVIIDKILSVMDVDRATIQPPPQMITNIGAEYIEGVSPQDAGYLVILDIDRLFDVKELGRLRMLRSFKSASEEELDQYPQAKSR